MCGHCGGTGWEPKAEEPYDALAACEAQIADREQKLAARNGKREYVENVKALRAEIERLKGVRDMIRDGRRASENATTER